MDTKEEVRCGFTVTEKRKAVWETQLNLFDQFKYVCKKYNLVYAASGGTCLGAVRHKGYIPWDDDMDLIMPREDYEKLCTVIQKELPSHMFFQIPLTDSGYSSIHARILDTNTTCIGPNIWNNGISCRQNIFIDVFAIDSVPDSFIKKNVHRFIYKFMVSIFKSRENRLNYKIWNLPRVVIDLLGRICFTIVKRDTFYKKMIKFLVIFNKESTKYVGLLDSFYHIERFFMNREWPWDTITVDFENRTIEIPREYDKILTAAYGDYHKYVMGGSLHEGAFYDPYKPYQYYLEHRGEVDFKQQL